MKKIAICIMTYKWRTDCMLGKLSNFPADKYDIYIVTQNNDPKLDEYKQFITADNIHIMNTTATSIQEKREQVRCKISELGYDYYFQIDDDIVYEAQFIDESCLRPSGKTYKAKKIPMPQLMDEMIVRMEKYDLTYITPFMVYFIGFGKPGVTHINKTITVCWMPLINVKNIDKYNIHYEYTIPIHEDNDFVFKILQAGLNAGTMSDYAIGSNCMTQGHGEANKSVIYNDEHDLNMLKLGTIARWHITPKLDKFDKIKFQIKWSKYFNTTTLPDIDPKILEYAKNFDDKGLVKYLKEIKK